jgi:hypothetical protein
MPPRSLAADPISLLAAKVRFHRLNRHESLEERICAHSPPETRQSQDTTRIVRFPFEWRLSSPCSRPPFRHAIIPDVLPASSPRRNISTINRSRGQPLVDFPFPPIWGAEPVKRDLLNQPQPTTSMLAQPRGMASCLLSRYASCARWVRHCSSRLALPLYSSQNYLPVSISDSIVMVTSRGEPANVEMGYQSGCTAYLTQPISPSDLL